MCLVAHRQPRRSCLGFYSYKLVSYKPPPKVVFPYGFNLRRSDALLSPGQRPRMFASDLLVQTLVYAQPPLLGLLLALALRPSLLDST